jgi:hypothetical protein
VLVVQRNARKFPVDVSATPTTVVPSALTPDGPVSIPPGRLPRFVIIGAAFTAVVAVQSEVNKIATVLKDCRIMDTLSDLQY